MQNYYFLMPKSRLEYNFFNSLLTSGGLIVLLLKWRKIYSLNIIWNACSCVPRKLVIRGSILWIVPVDLECNRPYNVLIFISIFAFHNIERISFGTWPTSTFILKCHASSNKSIDLSHTVTNCFDMTGCQCCCWPQIWYLSF